jgi:hypothetical protein
MQLERPGRSATPERDLETLFESGCVYVYAWGAGCERPHDTFDGEIVDSPSSSHPVWMS